MPETDGIFSKYPSDIQVKLKNPAGGNIWIPFVGSSFDITKEMTAEHYSGSRLPKNITEGNIDYKGTLETGWIVDGLPDDWEEQGYTMTDATKWEYLLYTYLINPSEQGSSVPFTFGSTATLSSPSHTGSRRLHHPARCCVATQVRLRRPAVRLPFRATATPTPRIAPTQWHPADALWTADLPTGW